MSACDLCGCTTEAFIPYGDGARCFDVYGCLAREAKVMRAERDQLRACMTTQLAVHQADRDQLRAEVAALRERVRVLESHLEGVEDLERMNEDGYERDIRALRERAEAAEAEVERLRAASERTLEAYDYMLAEVERLREDMYEILKLISSDEMSPLARISEIAHANLRSAHPQAEEEGKP